MLTAALAVLCALLTLVLLVYRPAYWPVLAVLVASLVVWCHRENITRLLRHEERRFRWHTGAPKDNE